MLTPAPILAASDQVTVGLFGVSVIVNAVVGLGLWNLNRRQRKMEGLEGKVEMLETERHEVVSKLVDERFRSMSHEVANSVHTLSVVVEDLRLRAKDGELGLRTLGESDTAIKIEVERRMGEFRGFVNANMIRREDFDDLRRELRLVVSRMDRAEGRQERHKEAGK